ncbi:galactosyltransferase-related protein [Gramella lutea]|uniref:Galactosyltransferase-related protein n=1 Tax=Christiangramia lutea TaxID=1607951 RepID=A0A9X1V263_9FLAO|nr:galactosyltransferase-related protein [Christiangramia lutea]MCH4821579.1 galactosyltransferase-related protein [Christiangramia lutea]
MISILIPYRNRDPERIKILFRSLEGQTHKNFKVYFIDYGSSKINSEIVKELCLDYSFVHYQYHYTRHQPWNKSRTLNSVIRYLDTEYCFVADVDIIFHPEFLEIANNLTKTGQTTYFQVGYLSSSESRKVKAFSEYSDYRSSTNEATGLSLFPVAQLKDLNGFDEFYHFWGGEDTDMHIRLKNAGNEVEYYDEKLLLLHQWHKSFQKLENNESIADLQLSGILPLNHQHLKNAISNKATKVNISGWGEIMGREDFQLLENSEVSMEITNEKRQVEDVLYGMLPVKNEGIIKISFKPDLFENSKKYKVKRMLGKKVPEYYTLREVKDMILLHLISFYRNVPYTIKVDNGRDIEVAIKFS